MSTDVDRENILSDFAMEADLTSRVLGAYIRRYPEHTLELTDLFHELTMADIANAVGEAIGTEEDEAEELEERIAMVGAALSGLSLRELARSLELPRDFIMGFRDARVRVGSVPSNVLLNLARAIDVKIQYFIIYLQRQSGVVGSVAFKADAKPQRPIVLEYDDFIERLCLDEDETKALEHLAGSNGRD